MSEPFTDGIDNEARSSPNPDQIADAHRLLASYPFASATPSAHVSRHLSSMSITAPIPSLAQAHLFPGNQYYGNSASSQHQSHPYSTQANNNAVMMGTMASVTVPPLGTPERQLWDYQRHETVRLLSEQASLVPPPTHSFIQNGHVASPPSNALNPQTHWAPSSYQATPFANSILQSTYHHPHRPPFPVNSGLAPTPSSLSNALGGTNYSPNGLNSHHPNSHLTPQSNFQRPTYTPDQSAAFFEEFLTTTLDQLAIKAADVQLQSLPTPTSSSSVDNYRRSSQASSSRGHIRTASSSSLTPPPPTPPARHVNRTPNPHFPHSQPSTHLGTPSQSYDNHPSPLRQSSNFPGLESPDPITMLPGPGGTGSTYVPSPSHHLTLSPRKRKIIEEMESPSIKRMHSANSLSFRTPTQSQEPTRSTKDANANKFQTLPSKGRVIMRPYVEIPPTPLNFKADFSTTRTSSLSSMPQKATIAGHGSPLPAPSNIGSSDAATLSEYRGRRVSGSSSLSKDDELGGFGSETDEDDGEMDVDGDGDYVDADPSLTGPGTTRLPSQSQMKGKRTGERDDRGPLQKFEELLEDIFEAEDTLPLEIPDDPLEPLSSNLFSRLTLDSGRPVLVLTPAVIDKLTKSVGQIARPGKSRRSRQHGGGTPGNGLGGPARGLADVDLQTLSRVLRLLGRGISTGDELDPFASPFSSVADEHAAAMRKSVTASPSKKKAKKAKAPTSSNSNRPKSRSKSRTPKPGDEQGEESADDKMDVDAKVGEVTETELAKFDRTLQLAKESIVASDCCLALLTADKLPKQLYSEELITNCISAVKNQLSKIIYPFVEATSDIHGHNSPVLQHVAKSTSTSAAKERAVIGEIFQILNAVLPKIDNLVSHSNVAMSDVITIQAVYIAIGPFFVVESGPSGGRGTKEKNKSSAIVLGALGGPSAFKGLRLAALSLIRSIFANHLDQRSWIIEEILSSLIKLPDLKQKTGQFRLRDGRSIHTVSALLLQLVQTSAHDVRLEAQKFARRRRELIAQQSMTSMADVKEDLLSNNDLEEIAAYNTSLESTAHAAKTIIIFLTQRAGKGKITKNTNESEYRAIFETLITDVLVVLFWPEWPAATVLLKVACQVMINAMDDVKSATVVSDTNGLKSMALDHLGVIAARLKTSQLHLTKPENENVDTVRLKSLDAIVSASDLDALDLLVSSNEEIATHLFKTASDDQAAESSRELTAATWGKDIAQTLLKCNSVLSKMEEEGASTKPEFQALHRIALRLKTAFREVWKDPALDVFDVGSEADGVRLDRLADELSSMQGIRSLFDRLLKVILSALGASAVFMRTKALRALGQIVVVDPIILRNVNVREAIENHLQDNSPAVRDAAVELIGKYVVSMPSVAGDYYQKIADRIVDTGLGVRKRVIKLLKSLYTVTESVERRMDICHKLVLRMRDEDDTVKDLAMKTVGELWFSSTNSSLEDNSTRLSHPPSRSSDTTAPTVKESLGNKVLVIIGVTSMFRDRQSPLEELLYSVAAEDRDAPIGGVLEQYSMICDALIDTLVDAADLKGLSVVDCIRTIYLFASAHPAIISTDKASTLLPYLKNPTNSDEQTMSDYLLKIFRQSVPLMSKTSIKFGQELQKSVQPMILKPSPSGGVAALQESVACLYVVVKHITHDFSALIGLLKSCNVQLRRIIQGTEAGTPQPQQMRMIWVLLCIVSLLCENCNFDALRDEHPELSSDINSISEGSITDHIYHSLLTLHDRLPDPTMRARVIQCLGFLFRSYPALMTTDASALLMDDVFSSPDLEARAGLLKIMQDFLLSESGKHSLQEKVSHKSKKKVDMKELVGNTQSFADSGVSSAVVQRYLPRILEAAVTNNFQIQNSAVEIIGFTVRQGLAHPIQCVPIIIALETSTNSSLSNRALAYHTILYTKHESLLNSRYLESARKSFEYQKTVNKDLICGFRMEAVPTALLHSWYSLVREKRAARQDFLKAIMKCFDLDISSLKCSQDALDFTRYMAENIASFEFKTQEEVLTVIRHLTSVLSVAGVQLIEALTPRESLDHNTSESWSSSQDSVDANHAGHQIEHPIELTRASVWIGLILLLKAYLKDLYALSEDKCMKWIPGKKSAVGDKAATRRREVPVSWQRMPFATDPILNSQDAARQQATFLGLWAEEGVSAEPQDDMNE